MIKVTTWYDNHWIAVKAYLEEKKLDFMLDNLWCILVLIIYEITVIAAIFCKYLQGHSTLLCNQHHTLKLLILKINSKVGVVQRFSEVRMA